MQLTGSTLLRFILLQFNPLLSMALRWKRDSMMPSHMWDTLGRRYLEIQKVVNCRRFAQWVHLTTTIQRSLLFILLVLSCLVETSNCSKVSCEALSHCLTFYIEFISTKRTRTGIISINLDWYRLRQIKVQIWASCSHVKHSRSFRNRPIIPLMIRVTCNIIYFILKNLETKRPNHSVRFVHVDTTQLELDHEFELCIAQPTNACNSDETKNYQLKPLNNLSQDVEVILVKS